MDHSDHNIERIERLAHEFAERLRHGETPNVEEYATRHPDIASQIYQLLPSLVASERSDETRTFAHRSEAGSSPVLGDYRLVRQIGRGGMGIVYEAEQRSLDRRVAVKVLPGEFASSPERMERFQREARAAARLHHTNIVPVFEVGREGETAFFAMQLIRGQSLDNVVRDVRRIREQSGVPQTPSRPSVADATPQIITDLVSLGRLGREPLVVAHVDELESDSPADGVACETVETPIVVPTATLPGDSDVSTSTANRNGYFTSVAQIGLQVAGALAYAHARGIVHRDIKPSNLLLDSAGVTWVTDFGLAKTRESDTTRTGDIVGTLRYMAPERFRGQCDSRADVYALGLTLYELLTLQPAFAAEDQGSLIESITKLDAVAPRRVDRHIPRDLETIVLKSIEKDPALRYQSADAVAEDLRRFLNEEPIRARPISPIERLLRWTRRNKSIAATLATVMVLLAGWAYREHRNSVDLRYRLAQQYLRQGQSTCEAGRIDHGLHFFVRALDECPSSRDALQWAIRTNFATWSQRCNQLTQLLDHESHLSSGGTRDKGLAAAFSPDGTRLLTGGKHDNAVRIWAVDTGEQLGKAMEHSASVEMIHMTSDGDRIVTRSSDGVVQRWNRNGARLGDPLTTTAEGPVAFSAATGLLAVQNKDGKILLWDVAKGQLRNTLRDSVELSLTFSGDGHRLRAAREGVVKVWDVESGTLVHDVAGLTGRVAAIHPDGESMIVIDARTPMVSTLDGETLVELGDGFSSAIYSSNGQMIATYGGGRFQLWSSEGVALSDVNLYPGAAVSVGFNEDSQLLGIGTNEFTLSIWSTETGERIGNEVTRDAAVQSVAFRPGVDEVVISAAGRAEIWSFPKQGSIVSIHEGHSEDTWGMEFSPDGDQFVTTAFGSEVWLHSSDPQRPLRRLPGSNPNVWDGAISPDGNVIAAGANREVRMWTIDGQPIAVLEHEEMVRSVDFDGTGERLATGTFGGTARVWDVESEQVVFEFDHDDFVEDVAFVPGSNTLVTACSDGFARIWSLDDLEAAPITMKHGDDVLGLAINPDGTLIATGSRDQTVRLWDAASGRMVGDVLEHAGHVEDVSFNMDGRLLASACSDGLVRIWDVPSGEKVGPAIQHSVAVRVVTFDPRTGGVLTAIGDKIVLWKPPSYGTAIEDFRSRVNVLTGMRFDDRNALTRLGPREWHNARRIDDRVNRLD